MPSSRPTSRPTSTPTAAKPTAATPAQPKASTKKPKLVRDSFTIPKQEFAAIDTLKARGLAAGVSVKKSELIRAGLMALSSMSDAALRKALAAVPTLKTGRPVAEGKPVAKPATKPATKPAPAKKAVAKKAKPALKATRASAP